MNVVSFVTMETRCYMFYLAQFTLIKRYGSHACTTWKDGIEMKLYGSTRGRTHSAWWCHGTPPRKWEDISRQFEWRPFHCFPDIDTALIPRNDLQYIHIVIR